MTQVTAREAAGLRSLTGNHSGGERIELMRLDHHDPELYARLLEAVEGIASRGAFTLGHEVEAFEQEFATYCEAEYAVGVSSGTEALALALRALRIGPGDDVIVPANSFIATAEAVTLVGAHPVLVDVDARSQLLTASIVEAALSSRTRAIIPVHLRGATVDLAPILELASDRGIAVIEDACQAHGALYRDVRVGSIGDIGCFSFYPSKNLGGWGDGGAVVTADPDLAERVRLLRSHGEAERYQHTMPGTSGRLHAIQAAVLRIKLTYLDQWNAERRVLAGWLDSALQDSELELPSAPCDDGDHVYHQFAVGSPARDELRAILGEHGVATGVHYPVPIHLTEAYRGVVQPSLPACEEAARTTCTLPLWPGMSAGHIDRIAGAVAAFSSNRAAFSSNRTVSWTSASS